jgi:hypothetical protein
MASISQILSALSIKTRYILQIIKRRILTYENHITQTEQTFRN